MIAFLKRPVVLIAIGLVLAAVVIWFVGPMIPLFGYVLASPIIRFELWLAIVLGVVGWHLYKRARASAAGDQLMGEMVEQAKRRGSEAAELQRTFEEAVTFLKQNRRKGGSVYDLPWYAIIGAPGAGKTTALVNSGLQFPMEKKGGRRPVKGVGGTRNCDWFFTQEAVLLDTAGRYTTQNTNEESDSSAWTEFLTLLKKYRRRRPLNGVLLALSVRNIVEFSARELDDYVSAARQRLDELSTQLGIQLPVYVLVTQCDLVPGFNEYFSDLSRDGRSQVWGVTFPFDRSLKGDAAELFPEELDALFTRLNERLYARLDAEQDPARRTKVFAFPQEMSALREPMCDFIATVFGSTRFEKKVLLRGVYLTSATQHGTSFEQLAAALAQHLSLPKADIGPGTGKAYFIERLLKDVILAESGLAGTNFRFELRKAAAQTGVYAAIVALAAVSVIGLGWSYARNRALIGDVAAEASALTTAPPPTIGSLETMLQRPEVMRRVVDTASRHQGDVPWAMRFGLYQGHELTDMASDTYRGDLQDALLPWLFERIERRLSDLGSESDLLYAYLKAYLMLTSEVAHQDPQHLTAIAVDEFHQQLSGDPGAAAALAKHAQWLFQQRPKVDRYDAKLVARARASVPPAAIPRLVYNEVRLSYAGEPEVNLDAIAGLDQVFRRRSGLPITTPVPGFFTPDAFFHAVGTGIDEAVARFRKDQWVWGEGAPPAEPASTTRLVRERYETEYIAAWQALLDDVEMVPVSGREQTAALLTTLGGDRSPLRGLLQLVADNTNLEPPTADGRGGLTDAATAAARGAANRATRGLAGRLAGAGGAQSGAIAGAKVKAHFAKVHEVVQGQQGQAPIDNMLKLLGQLGDVVSRSDPGRAGGISAGDASAQISNLQQQIGQGAAALPPLAAGAATAASSAAVEAVGGAMTNELGTLYRQKLGPDCAIAVNGNYPFVPASLADAPAGSVAGVFGEGGGFDQFFNLHLSKAVDPTDPTRWLTDASGRAITGPPGMLPRFKAAKEVKEVLFPPGSGGTLAFTLTPSSFDRTVNQVIVQVDAQTLTLRRDQQLPARITWSPMTSTFASLTVEGAAPIEARGSWALLRLFDRARVEGSGSRAMLTFNAGGREVRLQLDAAYGKNPITSKNLLRFQCGI